MAIIQLPQQQRRTGLQDFTEGMSPYLQAAFQSMLQKRQYEFQLQKQQEMQQQQRQTNMDQLQQMAPDIFNPVPEQYKNYANISGEQGIAGQGAVPIKPPEGYKPQYQFNPEAAQKYPYNVNLTTGEAEFKPQTPMFGYMGGQGGGVKTTPATIEEAKKQVSDMGENSADYSYEPVLSTQKGGLKVQTGFTPKFEPKLQENRIKNEERVQFIKDSAQDTLNTISEVEKGMGNFGLTGQLPSIPGTSRTTWESNINKLLSGKIINLMTEMKQASKTGATGFGQLSNKELGVLQEASTALKRGMSPKDAQKILTDMKSKLQKIVGGEMSSNMGLPQEQNVKPQYNPATQRLQQNQKTGEYRVVDK